MRAKTKRNIDWDFFAPVLVGIVVVVVFASFFTFLFSIEPDRAWCTNYPKAYSKAASAEYVDGIGCIVTDITGEKMPYDSFDRKYYP